MSPQPPAIVISDDDESVISIDRYLLELIDSDEQHAIVISDDEASLMSDVRQSVDIESDDQQFNSSDARYRRRDVETTELGQLIRPMPQPPSVWEPTSNIPLPLLFAQESGFFHDENACITYLWEKGVFYTENPNCPSEDCDGRAMNLKVSGRRIRWRCYRFKCNTELSLRRDTPFYGKKQQLHKLLMVYRMLLVNEKVMRIKDYTAINSDTIAQIKKDFNEMLLCDLASIPSK